MLKNYKIMCRAGNFIAKTGHFFPMVFTVTTGSFIFFRTEFRSHCYNSGGLNPLIPKCGQSKYSTKFLFAKDE